MELPNNKNFPFVAIFAMGTVILSLCGYIVAQQEICRTERKELSHEYQAKLDAAQLEIREIYKLQNAHNLRQDSIDRAQIFELEKMKRTR